MRENPNLDKKEEVITYVYALENNKVAKAAAENKDRINGVGETIDYKVSQKRHKKRACGYKCRHCGMLGSHKSDKCFKAFPELKRGRDDKRDKGERSKSRSQSRGRPRFGDSRRDDRQNPNTRRVVDKNSPRRYNREEDPPQDRDRDRGKQSRLPTSGVDVELTRGGKPRYDFLEKDSSSFEELRKTSRVSKQPLRRVREFLVPRDNQGHKL